MTHQCGAVNLSFPESKFIKLCFSLMYCKTIITMKSKWQDHNDWVPLFQREKRAGKHSVLSGRGRLRKGWIITFHITLKHRIHSVWLHAVIIASAQAIVYSHDINEKRKTNFKYMIFGSFYKTKVPLIAF